MTFQGLTAKLATAEDLLAKMRFDLERMEARPDDVYAAYDFFVTAEHMPEWANDPAIKKSEPLLAVVSHLATGAKHFSPKKWRHDAIAAATHRPGIFDPAFFDPALFDVGEIAIELQGHHAEVLGLEISAVDLARKVMAFWAARLHRPE